MQEYIEKNTIITQVNRFGESHEIPITAKRIAEMIMSMPGIKTERFTTGKILRDFLGLNISFGNCSQCRNRLIWYTANPPRVCPHCSARLLRDWT